MSSITLTISDELQKQLGASARLAGFDSVESYAAAQLQQSEDDDERPAEWEEQIARGLENEPSLPMADADGQAIRGIASHPIKGPV